MFIRMFNPAALRSAAEALRAADLARAATMAPPVVVAMAPPLVVAAPAGNDLQARTFDPRVGRILTQMARTQTRTQRFIELVREAMRRTGNVQVELNPCDVFTAEELLSAARAARQPLSLQLGGRSFGATLRDVRVRCPSNAIEWDYDLEWVYGMERTTYRGTVTLLGEQVLMGSLDAAMERPVHSSICYRNFRILRINLAQELEARLGLTGVRRVPESLLAEANALPLCIDMLDRAVIGITR